jgi:hypothetical protein
MWATPFPNTDTDLRYGLPRERRNATSVQKEATARRAEQEARVGAETRDLASRARNVLDSKPQLALLLASQAVLIARKERQEPAAYVRTTLADVIAQVQSVTLPVIAPSFLSVTDSDRVIAAVGNEVRVWSVEPNGRVSQVALLPAAGSTISHPHQGRWLAAGRADSVTMFDLTAAFPAAASRVFHGEYVSSSPDGRWLVTAVGT